MNAGNKVNESNFLKTEIGLGYKVPKEIGVLDFSFFKYVEKPLHVLQILESMDGQKRMLSRLPSEFEDIVEKLVEECRGPVIFRTSSEHEDGRKSFAGRYKSVVVEVPSIKNISNALCAVYSSMVSEKAVKYRLEHGIKNDSMGILIQEYLKADFSGVMLTSNPTYPDDLVIEFSYGNGGVVEPGRTVFCIEYAKESMEQIFKSESYQERFSERPFDIDKLAKIGVGIEKIRSPSDIEFLTQGGDIYLIQRRDITDIEKPKRVKVPKYEKEQYIGTSDIKRGTGKITLPALILPDIVEMIEKAQTIVHFDEDAAVSFIRSAFEKIARNEKKYSSGYVLVLPEFLDTISFPSLFVRNTGVNGFVYDDMTPHKKAIITTREASICSHAMTVARERGILYAGFEYGEDKFDNVSTGDVLSIYFVGRQAKVYLEKKIIQSIHEMHPEISFILKKSEKGLASVQTSGYIDEYKDYLVDFQHFLNFNTRSEWKLDQHEHTMGGIFTNKNGSSISIHMGKSIGSYHFWSIDPPLKFMPGRPVQLRELRKLSDKYLDYLREGPGEK